MFIGIYIDTHRCNMEDVKRKPKRRRIRTILSTTTRPRIFGPTYDKIIFLASPAWHLRKELKDFDSGLDLECSNNSVLRYATHRFWSTGVEARKDSRVESMGNRVHEYCIMADLTKLKLRDKFVNAGMLTEVLEHLTSKERRELVKKMSRVAREKIVIATTNGFIPQDGETNPYQLRKAGCEIPEFEELGFTRFRGCNELEFSGRKCESQSIFMAVQSIPQKVAYMAPNMANGLLSTKLMARE